MKKDIIVFPPELSLEVIYVYLSIIISLRSRKQEK